MTNNLEHTTPTEREAFEYWARLAGADTTDPLAWDQFVELVEGLEK